MRVSLVITDVIMTGMTGVDLARPLTERYPALRVILTSGYSNEVVQKNGARRFMFLEKPYTPAQLAGVVRDAFGSAAV